MAEYVPDTIAELVADLGDAGIGGAAMRAVVAAVFHQRDFGLGRADHMVARGIDRAIETIVHAHY